jgi:Zn-dependent protease
MAIIGWLLAFVVAITVHEAAHAWMSYRLGDPTAKIMGRLSLNPLAHYDPVGTTLLIVLVVLRALGFPVLPFGWAKPVVYDPFNLKNPRKDAALISLSGPASNLILALLISIVLRLTTPLMLSYNLLYSLLVPVIILNVSLAIFNLIPFHPLDGGKIFIGLLPEKDASEAEVFLSKYGPLIIIFLIFPTFNGNSPLFSIMSPIINFLLSLLIPAGVTI